MAISDAFNEELHDLADAGCPVIQMEEPQIHLLAARSYVDKVINPEFMLKVFNNTVKGLRAKTEVWCHTCWGNPSQQRMFGSGAELQAGAGAAEPGGRGRDHVRDEELEPDGPGGSGAGDYVDEGVRRAPLTTTRCRWRRRRRWRISSGRRSSTSRRSGWCCSSDCGMGREGMSRRHAFYKMVSLVQGTNLVKQGTGPAGDREPGGGSEVFADSDGRKGAGIEVPERAGHRTAALRRRP